jgi:hypothetical protein
MGRVFEVIFETWEYTDGAPDKLPFWLAAGGLFYTKFFAKRLADQVHKDKKEGGKHKDAANLAKLLEVRFILRLLSIIVITEFFIQDDTDDAVKNKILEEFLRVTDTHVSNTAKSIRQYVKEAESLRRELQNSKRSGRLCRNQALWIGVER